MEFTDPQVILFVADCERAARFYAACGFAETFRAPEQDPVKIEMRKDGFMLGLALPGPAAESHQLQPVTEGHRACLTLWCDDTVEGHRVAVEAGAKEILPPHPYLDGRLLVAQLEDPDGHGLQIVQRVR